MRELMSDQKADAPELSENTYLLLDGAALDAPYIAYSLDDEPQIEALFQYTRHEALAEASPWLVKPSPGSRLFIQRDSWAENGVALRAAVPFAVLAGHLRSLLSVKLPQGELAYCRFYSPGWAGRLFSSMTPQEFARWSGPVEHWIMAADASWHCFFNPGLTEARGQAEEGWFTLTQRQVEQFSESERQRFVDRVVERLRAGYANTDSEILRDHVLQGIEQAESYGLVLEYQVLHFLELRARFPIEFASASWGHHFKQTDRDPDLRLRIAEQKLFGLGGSADNAYGKRR